MNPLQIFPKHPSAPDTYYIGGGWSPACITAVEKRFTDAELAAEYYKAIADFNGAGDMHDLFNDDQTKQALDDARDWMFAMERFATLPHYDENPA